MNRSFFFEDQVYDWDRFHKIGSHTRTEIIPKLPPLRLLSWSDLGPYCVQHRLPKN